MSKTTKDTYTWGGIKQLSIKLDYNATFIQLKS